MPERDLDKGVWRPALRWGLVGALGLFGAGLAGALIAVVWQNPSRGQLLVQILGVLVSWPVVILVLGLAFGWTFREEIRRFLVEVRRVGYGGAMVEREQQARVSEKVEDEAQPQAPAPPTQVQEALLTRFFEDLEQDRAVAMRAAQELRTQLLQMYEQALFWWLRFLDLYLVPNSKTVLAFLQILPSTREQFHRTFAPFIPSRREREAILEALVSHKLLHPDPTTGQYRVTQAGETFLESQPQPGLGLFEKHSKPEPDNQ